MKSANSLKNKKGIKIKAMLACSVETKHVYRCLAGKSLSIMTNIWEDSIQMKCGDNTQYGSCVHYVSLVNICQTWTLSVVPLIFYDSPTCLGLSAIFKCF